MTQINRFARPVMLEVPSLRRPAHIKPLTPIVVLMGALLAMSPAHAQKNVVSLGPDLVAYVSALPDATKVFVRVRNIGNSKAYSSATEVTFTLNGRSSKVGICTVTLEPGEFRDYYVGVPTGWNSIVGDVCAKADALRQVSEVNEANNQQCL